MDMVNYYTIDQCRTIFNAVENPNWRIFKSIDEDGICRQNKRQITTPEKLYRFIHQCKNPQKLYVSVSTFLSPQSNHGFFANQKIETKSGHYYYPQAGYVYADEILIDSFFFIDIDHNDLRIVQDDAKKIIKYMGNRQDYKLRELNFSGTKGVHLAYCDLKKRKVKDPIKRIKYYHAKKLRLAKELSKLGLKTINMHHLNIMADVFRVRAISHSIKPNGNIVTPLSLNEFMENDIYNILRSKGLTAFLERSYKPIEVPKGTNDEKVATKNIVGEGKGRDGLSTYPYQYMCIANFVPGLKDNYVPFIKVYKNRLKHIDLEDLSRDMSHMYIFEEGKYYWIVGLKFFRKDKLLKIMRKLKAVNQSELQRRYNKFRYTNITNLDKQELEPPPRLIKTVKSDKIYKYSRAHYNFFKEFEISNSLLYGKDDLKTYLAEVES